MTQVLINPGIQTPIAPIAFFCFLFQKVVDPETLTDFVIKVSNATTVNKGDIVKSQVTVSTIVEILNNIADVSQNVTLDEVVVTVS